jgi:dienelactone hydrolase
VRAAMVIARLFVPILMAGTTLCAEVTPAQVKEWRSQIKEVLFVPDPPPPLAPVSYGSFEPIPGIIAELISYGTEFGMRVPAVLYHPANRSAQKAPGIVIVNGHGGDNYAWYSFYSGMLYVKAGAFVVTYDPIGEGERNSERKSVTRQHDIKVPPEEMGRRMAGLMINNVRQAVSYLSQRPEVDAARIAAIAYSMGSFLLGITCAIETRLNSCVLVGGGNLDDPGDYWDRSNHTMCQAIPHKSLMFLGDRGAVLYTLHALRGPTFVFNGIGGRVLSPMNRRDLRDSSRICKNAQLYCVAASTTSLNSDSSPRLGTVLTLSGDRSRYGLHASCGFRTGRKPTSRNAGDAHRWMVAAAARLHRTGLRHRGARGWGSCVGLRNSGGPARAPSCRSSRFVKSQQRSVRL